MSYLMVHQTDTRTLVARETSVLIEGVGRFQVSGDWKLQGTQPTDCLSEVKITAEGATLPLAPEVVDVVQKAFLHQVREMLQERDRPAPRPTLPAGRWVAPWPFSTHTWPNMT